MFSELVRDLNEKGAGVRAFDTCARAARARIPGEPDNAAALLLVSYAAQLFVDSYDDQPISVDEAAEELKQFNGIVSTLEKAFAAGSADEKLAALNSVAATVLAVAKS